MTQPDRTYDAIVIGSGISGGWAAKELCDHGLKTLVLERGRDVQHIKDYPTANMAPWELPHRGFNPRKLTTENPLISKAAGYGEDTAHFFVKDADHPYVQEKPFDWIRGYQVGGKSLIWGRATQRWSKYEFVAPERLGYGMNWPITYDDVAPWYSHVERFIGVCGNYDHLEAMPDGEFLPPFDFNCVEKHMRDRVHAKYENRWVVQGRWAHLSKPKQIHLQQGRGTCQARNLCMRGCPVGGYFSSNSSTLPWAMKTGNLTVRPHSVVHSIVYDDKTGKASGVRVIDANTHEQLEFAARIIFVNGSALNSTLVLLNSTSSRFPHGLGNDSGLLGKFVMHHNYRVEGHGRIDGFTVKYFFGRNPTECILVNFRNLGKQDTDFVGGYTTFTGAYRERGVPTDDLAGEAFKHAQTQAAEMLEAAGCHDVETHDKGWAPGLDIHEMGGARMGKDPRASVLNQWNQVHGCPNVFVTDGACMTSTGNQSPSILYMALTARAANHAVNELKRRNL